MNINVRSSLIGVVMALFFWSGALAGEAPVVNPGVEWLELPMVAPGSRLQDRSVASSSGYETDVSPEIQALADGLEHDPVRLFEFVKNHIRFDCTWTCRRDATQTLLDRIGNSIEQSALLIALLKASGHSAEFVHGKVRLAIADAANWIGTSLDEPYTTAINFGRGGIPTQYNSTVVVIEHVWVRLAIDNIEYNLDPSFKHYRYESGQDIATETGFDQTSLIEAALDGATLTDDYVSAVDWNAIGETLDGYCVQWLNRIRADHATDTRLEVLGGRQIEPVAVTELPTDLSYLEEVYDTYEDVPASLETSVTFTLPGSFVYATVFSAVLGKRVIVKYTSGVPELRIDGQLCATGSAGASGTLKIEVDSAILTSARVFNKTIYDWRWHAVVFNAGHFSSRTLERRDRIMRESQRNGAGADDEPVYGEVLAILGMTYFSELDMYDDLIGQVGDVVSHLLYGCAVVNGPAVDVGFNIRTAYPNNSDTVSWHRAHVLAYSAMTSAVEHGVLEQTQHVSDAISTVKGLLVANNNGQKVYTVTLDNFATALYELNYDSSFRSTLISYLSSGYNITIPQEDVQLNQWTGKPWIIWKPSGSSYGYMITGPARILGPERALVLETSFGGGPTDPSDDTAPPEETSAELVEQAQAQDSGRQTPQVQEPVNSLTGELIHTLPGLATFGGRGRQIMLDLAYRGHDPRSGPLGAGWRHSYEIALRQNASIWERALSTGSAAEGVAPLVAAYASTRLLYSTEEDIPHERILLVCMVNKWLTDHLTKNAVYVTDGDGAKGFARLPDGAYEPPAGVFSKLVPVADGFQLTDETGLVHDFNPDGAVGNLTDDNGNQIQFSYGDGQLESITDASGRAFNFSYDLDGRVEKIADPLSREIQFDYDDAGDLVLFTDPDGGTYAYSYDEQHLITEARDPRDNVFMKNTYDTFCRVAEQRDGRGKATTFLYGGDRTVVADPLGNRATYLFDDRGLMFRMVDPLGHERGWEYNGLNRPVRYTDANGGEMAIEYDAMGNPTRFEDAAGNVETSSFNAQNLRVESTDANGNTTIYQYDANRNLVKTIEPTNAETCFTYNDDGQVTGMEDADGVARTVQYDGNDYATRIEDELGNADAYTYDAVGRMLTRTDANNHTVTYTYDNRDNVLAAASELGSLWKFEYDGNGNITEIQRPGGGIYQFAYNENNRLGQILYPDTTTRTFGYNDAGELESVTDGRDNTTRLRYDAGGRLAEIETPAGSLTRFSYDAEGLPLEISAPGEVETSFAYNVRGLLGSVENEIDDQMGFGYDESRRAVSMSLAGTAALEREYDDASRLLAVVDPMDNRIGFQRTDAGRLEGCHFPDGAAIAYEFDDAGRVVEIIDQLLARETLARDGKGLVTERTRRDGTVAAYEYDALDRLLRIDYGDGFDIEFAYTPDNLVDTASNDAGTVRFTYDAVNRVVNFNDVFGLDVAFSYDGNGNLESLTYPGDKSVAYAYDEDNRLTAVTDWMDRTIQYSYGQNGKLERIEYPNQVVTEYEYDQAAQLSRIRHTGADGVFASYALTRTGGRIVGVDSEAPLSPASIPEAKSFAYDAANRVISRNDVPYSYDDDGRLLGDGVCSFSYNPAGQLETAVSSRLSWSCAYDALGNRVGASADGHSTRYLVVPWQGKVRLLAQMESSNSVLARYIYADGVAARIAADGSALYYHFDYTGNTVALTDADGDVSDAYAYSTYGELTASTGSTDNPFLFNGLHGAVADPTGLVYMRARYFDPDSARFVTEDPAGFSSGDYNLYRFARNDPVNFVDPAGLAASPAAEPEKSLLEEWLEVFEASVSVGEQVGGDFNVGPAEVSGTLNAGSYKYECKGMKCGWSAEQKFEVATKVSDLIELGVGAEREVEGLQKGTFADHISQKDFQGTIGIEDYKLKENGEQGMNLDDIKFGGSLAVIVGAEVNFNLTQFGDAAYKSWVTAHGENWRPYENWTDEQFETVRDAKTYKPGQTNLLE